MADRIAVWHCGCFDPTRLAERVRFAETKALSAPVLRASAMHKKRPGVLALTSADPKLDRTRLLSWTSTDPADPDRVWIDVSTITSVYRTGRSELTAQLFTRAKARLP